VRALLFLDLNDDGVQDAGDPSLSGVRFNLSSASVSAHSSMFSAASVSLADHGPSCVSSGEGLCAIDGVPYGDYQLRVDPDSVPAGVSTTADPDQVKDLHTNVSVSGAADTTEAFGVAGVAGVAGTVFSDSNHNGQVDPSDPPLANVQIAITFAGADGVFGTDDDLVITTTTDGAGRFSAGNLPYGNYRVQVVASSVPPGMSAPPSTDVHLAPDAPHVDMPVPLVPSNPASATLPRTGGDVASLVAAGLAFIGAGVALLLSRRRRARPSH
jgi:LPXTG-motif cell wall-anchored protein